VLTAASCASKPKVPTLLTNAETMMPLPLFGISGIRQPHTATHEHMREHPPHTPKIQLMNAYNLDDDSLL
jgi:hypothetical protein